MRAKALVIGREMRHLLRLYLVLRQDQVYCVNRAVPVSLTGMRRFGACSGHAASDVLSKRRRFGACFNLGLGMH